MKQSTSNYKILLVGDSIVGKTSILMQYCMHHFKNQFMTTIGVDFKIKNIQINNQKVCLNIWDTAGQQRYRNIAKSFFNKADGVVLIYSIANRDSFNHIQNWIQQINNIKSLQELSLILVGNKYDLEDEREVTRQEGQTIAKKYKIQFIEVSAKTNQNVQKIFLNLGSDILTRSKNRIKKIQEPVSIVLESLINKSSLSNKNKKDKDGCAC